MEAVDEGEAVVTTANRVSNGEVLRRGATGSPVGRLTLLASDRGLRAVMFENSAGGARFGTAYIDDESAPVLAAAARQLGEYFAGTRRTFSLPLDLVGTAFQLEAWTSLAGIPYGETVSYGEQAARIGRPTAVRAVGAANGRNPVSIVLPCHRVIGADGSLTGFGGGLHKKRYLLELEGSLHPGVSGGKNTGSPR